MTASAGAWYRVGTVNVTKNNQTVTGVATNWQNDVIAIAVGDIFTLDAKTWYEVTAVASDTSITLDRGFEGATGAGQSYAIVRNTSGTILTRIAGQVSVQFNQKQLFLDELRTWLNSTNASEELTDSHGLKRSHKTPAQMVADHDNRLAELDEIHPYPWAMRKVEFEARRAANNEKFAASGFVHFGKSYQRSGYPTEQVGEGLFSVTYAGYENSLALGKKEPSYSIGQSKTESATINVAGVIFDLRNFGTSSFAEALTVKLPSAEDGTRTYDSATGASVTHATSAIAFASETATNKVVIDRVDMWGFEAFLREINDTDPFVYVKGLIQSRATTFNGVPIVADNVRPITYFAWYEGDEDSRGRGVNWQTASEANRIKIASDPANNIYFDDETGKFYQWCVRGRSFAGKGNGDWGEVDALGAAYLDYSISAPIEHIRPLGNRNSVSMAGSGFPLYSARQGIVSHFGTAESLGIFGAMGGSSSYDSVAGIGGECYFLVCGTVSRLNQGAYHPNLNPSGSSKVFQVGTGYSYNFWHTDPARKVKTLSDCFKAGLPTDPSVFINSQSAIGSMTFPTLSGRPDGRFFDVIYASGQGGVCRDMRYSAWGLTQEDFAEADLAVKSGKYRGRELLTTPLKKGVQLLPSSAYIYLSTVYFPSDAGDFSKGIDKVFLRVASNTGATLVAGYEDLDNGEWWEMGVALESGSGRYILKKANGPSIAILSGNASDLTVDILIVSRSVGYLPDGLKIPVVGEYLHTEVIADPKDIMLCDDLKDGWIGSWNPELPDGEKDEFELTRPYSGAGVDITRTHTLDNGATWTQAATAIENVPKNIVTVTNMPTNQVTILQYTTKAKLTTSAVRSKPYCGKIGSILATMNFSISRGALLSFSTGVLLKSSAAIHTKAPAILNAPLLGGEFTVASGYDIEHHPLSLPSPNNNSPAFKALNYNVVENQQGFINYAYTELTYDAAAGDWGDDGKIHIVDNQSTMLDTNGNTVKVGTARIVEPLGWIKNDK